jgi:prepilin-type N-terminal cleavage/methylation domain-containing protein
MNFSPKSKQGFTLIELLVAIAIIGILSSVVLASLNSARDKGKASAIKSNLRNMIPQMELSYADVSNYSGINSSNSNTTCTGPIANMVQSITNAGATVRCLSFVSSTYLDVYLRFGVTSIIYDVNPPVKAWSTSPQGVVTWDAQGVNSSGAFVGTDVSMYWDVANTACATTGGRLPTLEELKTLADATFIASGSTYTPPGFVASAYWSSVTVPSTSSNAYLVNMSSGVMSGAYSKESNRYVHCVR